MNKKAMAMLILATALAGGTMSVQAAPLKTVKTVESTNAYTVGNVTKIENVETAAQLTDALKAAYNGATVEIVLKAGATIEIVGEQTIYSNVTINLNGGTIKATDASKETVLYVKADSQNVAIYGGNIIASGNAHAIYTKTASGLSIHDLNM